MFFMGFEILGFVWCFIYIVLIMFFYFELKFDYLEMFGVNEFKLSLKDEILVKKKKRFYVFVVKWEELLEYNKCYEIWEKYSLLIILVCVIVFLFIYSIVVIVYSGFDKVKFLFGFIMFLWFCMTYMFISKYCGVEIY